MRRLSILSAAAAATMLLAAAAVPQSPAQAGYLRAGALSCHIAPGLGFVVISSKELDCMYQPANGRRVEYYSGRITRVGVDLGFTGPQVLGWAVLVATNGQSPVLEGGYGGVSAQATAIVGVGANALLGGGDNSVVLQPISLTGQVGLNIAAGITGLRLYAR